MKKLGMMLHSLRKLKCKRLNNSISKIKLEEYLSGCENIENFIKEISCRKTNSFFFTDKEFQSFKDDFPINKEVIFKDADGICVHNFNLLGSGKKQVDAQPGKIDWHRDFKSGVSWAPTILYIDTEIIKGQHSDIKVPWELSRFQYLPTLGKTYWLTDDEKYSNEFVTEINDWIDSNSPFYGVNWTCTMDVAIRAVNWIWGYYFFKDSPELSDEFLKKFLKSLYIHGKYIKANLEHSSRLVNFAGSILRRQPDLSILKPGWHELVSNHYLSDIVGLIYLGMMLPEFKESKKWPKFGIRELLKEMRAEVYPDGEDYEGSISYHRLVTELFLSATLLCIRNNISFPDWYMKRLENMLDFIMHYSKPDGTAPQIGDNDDGRLHILANYGNWNRLDHRYLLSIGAVLFNRPDFKQASGGFHEETFWLLGSDSQYKYNGLPEYNKPIASKAFMQSGFYFMRKADLYMAIDCLNMDKSAPSGHKHNSRLSFELYAGDKSFIIDPGAYIYTADKEMRNLFRSTRYHNTVVVDEEEQNRFNLEELFNLERDSTIKVNKWDTTEKLDILDAEHYGYKRLKNPVIHRRQIIFDKLNGYWVVKDLLTGEGVHQLDLYFHFAPMDLEVDKDFPLVIKTKTKGTNLAIIPLDTEGISVEVLEEYISYQYGVKVKARIVKYSAKSSMPFVFENVLYPYNGEINISEVIRKAKIIGD